VTKLRKSAENKQCQIRIPGTCDNKNVCLCHINGAGWALKSLDIHASFGCQKCHDVVDGRKLISVNSDLIKLWFLEGVIRTQEIMVTEGLIKF